VVPLRSGGGRADAVRMQDGARSRSTCRGILATAIVVVALVAALGACGGSSGSTAKGTPSFSDPSTPITVKVGQDFDIRLAANPTTGYSWRVGQTVPALAQQISARYVAPKTDKVGAGGTAVVRFEATKRGTGGLALAYVGPGTDAPTARTVTFQLTVT
jgi:predicted secreted protein